MCFALVNWHVRFLVGSLKEIAVFLCTEPLFLFTCSLKLLCFKNGRRGIRNKCFCLGGVCLRTSFWELIKMMIGSNDDHFIELFHDYHHLHFDLQQVKICL